MPPTATNFESGMSQSFSKAVAPQASTGVNQKPGPAPTNNLSTATGGVPASGSTSAKPVAATPAAKPTVPTVNPTAPPAPTPPAPATAKGKVGFTATVPEGLLSQLAGAAKTVGSLGAAGANAYQNFQNMGWTDKLKMYMSDPNNFAQAMGALAPVAAPLLRTGGMPLMLGAYSFLRDKNYLNELSNGKIPKMGAANPLATGFKMDTPSVTGTLTPAGSAPLPDAAMRMPSQGVAAQPWTTPAKYDAAAGVTGLSAGLLSSKIPNAFGKAVGKSIAPAFTVAELAGVREKLTGAPERGWRDVADDHQKSLHPANWLDNYGKIYNDKQMDPISKGISYAGNTFANPAVLARIDPVGNALSAVKGLDDWTGASNAAHALSGGAFGTDPNNSQTRSVPASIGTMLSMGQPAPQKRVAQWGR